MFLRSHLLLAAAIALASWATPVVAQVTWSRSYSPTPTEEIVHAMRELPDGDIVMVLGTDDYWNPEQHGWLVRIDPYGRTISSSYVGHSGVGNVSGAVVLADGGAVFATRIITDSRRWDCQIVRVASDGSVEWAKLFQSPSPVRLVVYNILPCADGTFLCVGAVNDRSVADDHVGWMVKLDAAGDVVWERYYTPTAGNACMFLDSKETTDGGFILTGLVSDDVTYVSGEIIVKTTSAGDIEWGWLLGDYGSGISVVELRSGGYVVGGHANPAGTVGADRGWLTRVDELGVPVWSKTYGRLFSIADLVQTADADLVAVGTDAGWPYRLWAAKVDLGTGEIVWQRLCVGMGTNPSSTLIELASGDLLLGSQWHETSNPEAWLVRTNSDGRVPGCTFIGSATSDTQDAVYTRVAAPITSATPVAVSSPGTTTVGNFIGVQIPRCGITCPPVTCTAIAVAPDPACEGTRQTLTLTHAEGEPPVTVSWDVDGNTTPDLFGPTIAEIFPLGTTTVTAFATDGCRTTPSTCSLSVDVSVVPATRPSEVSDVQAGDVPLLVLDHGATVSFEDQAGASVYNIYAGAIGTWFAPDAAHGTACAVATTPGGAGRLAIAPSLPAATSLPGGTWILVSASNPCESSAGRVFNPRWPSTERTDIGTWTLCGP